MRLYRIPIYLFTSCHIRPVVGWTEWIGALRPAITLMAFVPRCLPTRLDYCNSVLWASPIKLLQRLQSVQHAVSSARRREHISLILRELHRLHICTKIALLMYTSCLTAWHRRTWLMTIILLLTSVAVADTLVLYTVTLRRQVV